MTTWSFIFCFFLSFLLQSSSFLRTCRVFFSVNYSKSALCLSYPFLDCSTICCALIDVFTTLSSWMDFLAFSLFSKFYKCTCAFSSLDSWISLSRYFLSCFSASHCLNDLKRPVSKACCSISVYFYLF